jgi:hypothetical protein
MELINKIIAEINFGQESDSVYEADCLRCSALQSIRKWIDIDGIYQYAKNHNVLIDGSSEKFAMQFYSAYNNEVQFAY